MEVNREADIVTERCPKCHGIFLDKGELNVLATGHSGNIEYCSIDHEEHRDSKPKRMCAKCEDVGMQKINLLLFSDIIFDYCPNCEALFLDSGEVGAMNAELAKLSPVKTPEEIREYRDGLLVRVDRLMSVGLGSSPIAAVVGEGNVVNATTFKVAVYFKKPLELGLRVFPERWIEKLAKALRLYSCEDISTGHPGFDDAFLIRGNDKDAICRLFESKKLREALLSLKKNITPLGSVKGQLEINDTGVFYSEGPYSGGTDINIQELSRFLIDRMLIAAKAFGE